MLTLIESIFTIQTAGNIISGVAGGIAGGAATLLGSYIIENIKYSREKRRDYRHDLLRRIDKIEALSSKYWNKKFTAEEKQELESDLKETLKIASYSIQFIHMKSQQKKRFKEIFLEIRHYSTGGDFESSNIDPDSERINQVKRLCYDLRRFIDYR